MRTTKRASGKHPATHCLPPGRFPTVKNPSRAALLLFLVFISGGLTGCATMYQGQAVGPTDVILAQGEIPEAQLLDVGIMVFDTETVTEKTAEKEMQDTFCWGSGVFPCFEKSPKIGGHRGLMESISAVSEISKLPLQSSVCIKLSYIYFSEALQLRPTNF